MALLKRKGEKTSVASIRLPISAIEELHVLRKLADDKGYDLNASMTDALLKWLKQIREELGSNSDLPALPEMQAQGRHTTSSGIIPGIDPLPDRVEHPNPQAPVTASSNGIPTDRRA